MKNGCYIRDCERILCITFRYHITKMPERWSWPVLVEQKTELKEFGVNASDVKYYGEADKLIRILRIRKRNGLATLRQLLAIERMRIKTNTPLNEITSEEADNIISGNIKRKNVVDTCLYQITTIDNNGILIRSSMLHKTIKEAKAHATTKLGHSANYNIIKYREPYYVISKEGMTLYIADSATAGKLAKKYGVMAYLYTADKSK